MVIYERLQELSQHVNVSVAVCRRLTHAASLVRARWMPTIVAGNPAGKVIARRPDAICSSLHYVRGYERRRRWKKLGYF